MMVRWSSEDPRVVLLGRADGDWKKWESVLVPLVDGPLKGGRHTQGGMAEDCKDGDLLVLRANQWSKAK